MAGMLPQEERAHALGTVKSWLRGNRAVARYAFQAVGVPMYRLGLAGADPSTNSAQGVLEPPFEGPSRELASKVCVISKYKHARTHSPMHARTHTHSYIHTPAINKTPLRGTAFVSLMRKEIPSLPHSSDLFIMQKKTVLFIYWKQGGDFRSSYFYARCANLYPAAPVGAHNLIVDHFMAQAYNNCLVCCAFTYLRIYN